jgi:hypothetical protein
MTDHPFNDAMVRGLFLAQATATMGLDPAWDRAVADYVARDLRSRAHEEFGPFVHRRNEQIVESSDLQRKHGEAWKDTTEGKPMWERHWEISKADDNAMREQFYEPLWESHRRLVKTPAPSLAAAVLKASIIELYEVWNDCTLLGDCIAIIDDDLARLVPLEGGAA